VGQALVNVNSVQLIPVVSVLARSLPACGWTTEQFSGFNSIGFRFRDFFLCMAFMSWFIVGFGDRAEYSVLPGISTLACVLHGFGAMGADR